MRVSGFFSQQKPPKFAVAWRWIPSKPQCNCTTCGQVSLRRCKLSIDKSILYVVATPLGNLGDMSPRAVEVLTRCDLIAAEDTRHTGALLRHFGIHTACVALHEYNERASVSTLVQRLLAGDSIALVSDAGTPLISDPGYHLVREAREHGIRIVPVPGPCALVTALSASGLPSDRFVFEGFLPARQSARRARLNALRTEPRTLIFYESPHRILDCMDDLADVFGADRPGVLARELTKLFETIQGDRLDALCAWLRADPNQQRGEFVIVVQGSMLADRGIADAEAQRILSILTAQLPIKQAASLVAEITGIKKNTLYDLALNLRNETSE